MRFRGVLFVVALAVCGASQALAQPAEPVGPFAVDIRGLTTGLPTAAGWVPPLATTTVVPSRGYGLDFGVHVYPFQMGPARVGFGGALTFARGTAGTDTIDGREEVVTRSSTLAPQVSFNFGHRQGWSHLSFGYGLAKVTSDASGGALTLTNIDQGWGGAINFGGGARWFLSDHFGVGFDVRWHKLRSREASAATPAAPRTTLFQIGVGVTLH